MFGWFKKQKPLDVEDVISKIKAVSYTFKKLKRPLFYGLQGFKIEAVKEPIFIISKTNYDSTFSWVSFDIYVIDLEKYEEAMRSLGEIYTDPRVNIRFITNWHIHITKLHS